MIRLSKRLSVPGLAALIGAAAMMFCSQASAQAEQNGDASDNIVVILDASGSMAERMPGSSEKKMQVAKEALLQVMEHVDAQTNVGLLVFSGSNKRGDWVYPLGPLDPDVFAAGLMRLGPDGGTPLGEYIRKGTDRLLEKRAEQHGYGTYRLLIVTDGQASDTRKVQQFTPDALSRGIVIDVIGVAMAGDHSLATRVHSYRRANDAASLQRAILESVAEIGSAKDDTATDDESFALIAPLPDGMAEGLLTAVTTNNNEPIRGSSAWTKPFKDSANHAPSANANNRSGTNSQGNSGGNSGGTSGGRKGFGSIIMWVVIIAIALKVIQSVTRKAKS